MKYIVNGDVYTPSGVVHNGVVGIHQGTIAVVGTGDTAALADEATLIDAAGLRVIPGLIDLHIHGAHGIEVLMGDLATFAAYLPEHGITACLPTLPALSPQDTLAALAHVAGFIAHPPAGARLLGVHMEGPYVSPKQCGALDPNAMRPFSWDEFVQIQTTFPGLVKLMTVAPEIPPILDYIPRLLATGLVLSVGHSNATYEEVQAAIALGLNHATHTYNAMRPFLHREPGVVGAVLLNPQIVAQIIADGEHVHPGAIRLLLAAKGVDYVCLVSDALSPAGLPPGVYDALGYSVISDGKAARLARGTLAGAIILSDQGLSNLVNRVGLSFAEALRCATAVPARVLGLNAGRIVPGADADIVLMDEEFRVQATLVRGEIVFSRRSASL